jgi:DNA polymerase III subunit delta'
MQFDSFIGNRRIIERLRTKLREDRFPHGLIFSGPEGVGKYSCAIMLAKALNCRNAEPGDFCDACTSCRRITSGIHPDVMRISVEEDATQIKVAQIRYVLGLLELQPLEGRNKVFIVDPADALNLEAANALLKGLEEPPENSVLVLITVNVHELLLTVRSRCQVYHFTPLSLDEIRRHGITDELAVRWSQGSIGRARGLDIARLKSEREIMLDFVETVLNAREEQFQELLSVSAELGRAKQDFEGRITVLSVLLADMLYLKENAAERLVNMDLRERLLEMVEDVAVERLLQMAGFIGFIESSLKTHVNRQMLTDVLAITGNETAASWLQ